MSISQSSSELDLDAMVSSSAGSLFLTEGEKTGSGAPVIVRRLCAESAVSAICAGGVCGFRAFCGSCAYALMGVREAASFLVKNVLRSTGSVRPQTRRTAHRCSARQVGGICLRGGRSPDRSPELVGRRNLCRASCRSRGNVDVTRFKSLDNDFNVIGPVAGIDDRDEVFVRSQGYYSPMRGDQMDFSIANRFQG